jgi:hypothetical protein
MAIDASDNDSLLTSGLDNANRAGKGHHMKKNKRAESLFHKGGCEKCILTLLLENQKGRDHSRRWEDDIEVGLKVVGTEGVDWIHLAHVGVQ